MSRVYIILLNWNNWQDTLECLESLLALDYPDFRIVVCDNASTDGSLVRLHDWACGRLDIIAEDRSLQRGRKPFPKPIAFRMLNAPAPGGGTLSQADPLITVIRNQDNLGFAGGCNVGLRYALGRGDADYFWLLNNDTIVDPRALTALVERMRGRPRAGMCGSSVMRYYRPDVVDALGGARYFKWLGLAWHLGRERRRPTGIAPEALEKHMDYVVGSSMLVTGRFLLEVGLMSEDYFLYFEEIDWAMRGRERFSLAYAPDSLIYHKVGRSIGTSSHPAKKSPVCDYYALRNRLKFTRRHFPLALPSIYLGLIGAAVLRLLFGQLRKARMVLRIIARPDEEFDGVKVA